MFSNRNRNGVAGLLASLVLAACAPAAVAQVSPTPQQPVAPVQPLPQIHTSATEEVEITPDRALVSLSVETRGRTAAAASAENARIQAAVLDSLKRLGIDPKDIRTQGLNVMPEYQYPRDGGRPTVIGYQATNTIQVELAANEKVGAVIDAALAKGVTRIGGLHFFASSTAEARRDAIRKAVARARADAEAIAAAAGGSLGALVEISAGTDVPDFRAFNQAPMMMARAERADVQTPVEPGQVRVSASVSVKYAFVAGR